MEPNNLPNEGNPQQDLKPQEETQPVVATYSDPSSGKGKKFKIGLLVLIFLTLVMILSAAAYLIKSGKVGKKVTEEKKEEKKVAVATKVEKFTSNEEFKRYIKESTYASAYYGISQLNMDVGAPSAGAGFEGLGNISAPSMQLKTGTRELQRVSETNVQVKGIDEPDIVKTDGKNIFFSSPYSYYYPVSSRGLMLEDTQPQYTGPKTKVIKAFPTEEMAKLTDIDDNGNLLLSGNILIIISNNKITAYDVANAQTPTKKWNIDFENQIQYVSSRLYNNKLYLITSTYVYYSTPCPIPLIKGGASIECFDIYHPPIPIQANSTYTAMIVNLDSGNVENKASFVSSQGTSVVYMSLNSIYVTYTYQESMVNFFTKFITEDARDLVSDDFVKRLEKLQGYDISEEAKMIELARILQDYESSLTEDERLKVENEMQNKLETFLKDHSRDLEKTGIVRFDADNLSVSSSEVIPGEPLNQFSIDEYNDNLRIATTISDSFLGSGNTSVNDVYVLDKNLSVIGKVTDLGLTERIYSARFIEDKGYVVTFRQIDPFYVLDLSDPKNPKKVGELKIPGYSSYLHPITKDKIIGIGEENFKVKLSLFDVSNPANPTELSKYSLDEYWTEVESTHHAFLLDDKHQIFFLPGGKGGYIFSYKDNQLNLAKAVSDTQVKRAIYINDYLYIIADNQLTVLDENTWEQTSTLSF